MIGAGRDWREVLESYPCETCGAGPGEPCRTMTGNPKAEVHAPRSRLAHDNGWHFAEQEARPPPPHR